MKIHFVFLLIALVPSTTTQGQMNPNVPAWAAPLDDAHLLSDPLSRQNELMDMPNSHHARNIPEVLEVARDLLHQQGVQFSNARVIYGAEEGFLLPSLNIPEIARALTTPADSRDGLRPRRGQGLIFVAFDGRDLAEDNYRTDNDQIMLVSAQDRHYNGVGRTFHIRFRSALPQNDPHRQDQSWYSHPSGWKARIYNHDTGLYIKSTDRVQAIRQSRFPTIMHEQSPVTTPDDTLKIQSKFIYVVWADPPAVPRPVQPQLDQARPSRWFPRFASRWFPHFGGQRVVPH